MTPSAHSRRSRLTTPALAGGARADGVDAWLDKAKLLPGQGWELEIRKVVCERL